MSKMIGDSQTQRLIFAPLPRLLPFHEFYHLLSITLFRIRNMPLSTFHLLLCICVGAFSVFLHSLGNYPNPLDSMRLCTVH